MALVGGTDTSKEVPLHFKDAWDHPDIAERKLWRDNDGEKQREIESETENEQCLRDIDREKILK